MLPPNPTRISVRTRGSGTPPCRVRCPRRCDRDIVATPRVGNRARQLSHGQCQPSIDVGAPSSDRLPHVWTLLSSHPQACGDDRDPEANWPPKPQIFPAPASKGTRLRYDALYVWQAYSDMPLSWLASRTMAWAWAGAAGMAREAALVLVSGLRGRQSSADFRSHVRRRQHQRSRSPSRSRGESNP